MFPYKIKLVTFDVTHTLLRFTLLPSQYYAEVASRHGVHSLKNPEVQKQVDENYMIGYKAMSKEHPNFGRDSGITWSDWWREVIMKTLGKHLDGLDKETVRAIGTELLEDFKTADRWAPHDGSLDLLNYLKSKKIKIGVISNFDPRLTDVLKSTKLLSYFDFVVTSYDVGKTKPDPLIFQEALKRSGLDRLTLGEALHIGDDLKKDFHGATNAGWQAVLIGSKNRGLLQEGYQFDSLIDFNSKLVKEESNVFE